MDALEESRLSIREVDRQIAALFEERMHLAGRVLEIKKARGRPAYDPVQEEEVLSRGLQDISDPSLKEPYSRVLKGIVGVSRSLQEDLLEGNDPGSVLFRSGDIRYRITVGRDISGRASGLFDLDRKVLIVTDSGVPSEYSAAILSQCPQGSVFTLPQGEGNKTLASVESVLRELLSLGFTRSDAVIAVGGGTVGDIAGFAAACYERGIDWYCVPTTLLAQADASVGGKTAVNIAGVKNIAGAFHHPKGVLADTATLRTLSPRCYAEGMAEIIKIAATCDAALFSSLEDGSCGIEETVRKAVALKASIVGLDPHEDGLRSVLNFGHTVGHAIESAGSGIYHHGEAVAIGMTYFSGPEARGRIESLLLRYGLPVSDSFGAETLMQYASRDKKKSAAGYKTVWVDSIGSYRFRTLDEDGLRSVILNHKQK